MSRRRLLVAIVSVALVLSALAYLGAAILDAPQDSEPEIEAPEEGALIQPAENSSYLWPFTSRSQSVDGRTLAINVIILGESDEVRRSLTDRSNLGFEEIPEEQEEAEGDTYQIEISDAGVDWDDAHGSIRYVYMGSENGEQWMDESYQLHEGEYLGQRHHIRAYDDPEGEFTAIQIHREYFDFFRLRHSVTDIDDSAVMLEREFIDEPFVEEVRREHHGLRGGWSDGWVTTVRLGTLFPVTELLALLAIGSVASNSTRQAVRSLTENFVEWIQENWQGFALMAVLIVLVTGARTLGIALEQAFPDVSTQLFAGAVYPVLAVGPPLAVAVLVRRLEPVPALAFAVLGLGLAFALDTLWVGLGVVPVRMVLHRVGLMLALGVIALGVAREVSDDTEAIDHERKLLIAAGVIAWFGGLVMPLLDMI